MKEVLKLKQEARWYWPEDQSPTNSLCLLEQMVQVTGWSYHLDAAIASHLHIISPLLQGVQINNIMAPIHRKIIGSLPTAAKAARRAKSQWNHILVFIAMAAIGASWLLMWHQTRALASLQLQYEMLKASSSEKIMSSSSPEPIRFISVVGLFHSGTTVSIMYDYGCCMHKCL